jgi:HlyD family secretion protein
MRKLIRATFLVSTMCAVAVSALAIASINSLDAVPAQATAAINSLLSNPTLRSGYDTTEATVGSISRIVTTAIAGIDSLLSNPTLRSGYDTTEATVGSISRIVTTSGPVRPWTTVQIGSQLSGQIRRVLADFNSDVKEGDILAELDARMFEARVEQAEADLAMARAALASQQATLLKAEAVLDEAEQSRGRQRVLSQKGVTTQASLDTIVRDTRVAEAEIAITRAQIENAQANVKQREALLNQARIDLDRTRISSPINGTVVSRTVDIGQTVAASLQAPELFRIAQDLRSIYIEAQANEADVGAIAQGNPATFTVDTYPGRLFEGRVAQVRLAPNEVQSVVTYSVVIEASNADLKLFPGMTANVRIETARHDDVLRIPAEAMRFKPPGAATKAEGTGGRSDGRERDLERLKELLKLTDDQVKAVSAALTKHPGRRQPDSADLGSTDETHAQPEKAATKAGDRSSDRIEAALLPLLTTEQQRTFETWKAKRDATRPATVYVLGLDGQPEMRTIRIGLSDSRFAEVVSGPLKAADALIVRAHKETVR